MGKSLTDKNTTYKKTKYIIDETFKTKDVTTRKQIFENLLVTIIKKLEINK